MKTKITPELLQQMRQQSSTTNQIVSILLDQPSQPAAASTQSNGSSSRPQLPSFDSSFPSSSFLSDQGQPKSYPYLNGQTASSVAPSVGTVSSSATQAHPPKSQPRYPPPSLQYAEDYMDQICLLPNGRALFKKFKEIMREFNAEHSKYAKLGDVATLYNKIWLLFLNLEKPKRRQLMDGFKPFLPPFYWENMKKDDAQGEMPQDD